MKLLISPLRGRWPAGQRGVAKDRYSFRFPGVLWPTCQDRIIQAGRFFAFLFLAGPALSNFGLPAFPAQGFASNAAGR